jgi:hypothetical protein
MEHIVPDVVFERARAHFNEQELIAIVFTLTTINAWNRLAITMRTEVGNYGLLRDLALFILLRPPPCACHRHASYVSLSMHSVIEKLRGAS